MPSRSDCELTRNPSATARFAFIASTGRTATMFVASALNNLPGVTACHEGHTPDDDRTPLLPLVNLQNRQAWASSEAAMQVVHDRRSPETLASAAGDADLLVDVAFYNAPLLPQLAQCFPTAPVLPIVRRCEGFVRSATIMEGEDLQPAGWPDPAKELSDRERFIQLGRLRPQKGTPDASLWSDWSAIQRNIWLWHTVNRHLVDCARQVPQALVLRFEDLQSAPEQFWAPCLTALDVATAENLASCVARSSARVNARSSYHVGPLESWSADEQELHHQLARPLEEEIYE